MPFAMKQQSMLRLSHWAKSHRTASIAIISVAKIIIGAVAFDFGIWSALEGLSLPSQTKWLLWAVSAICVIAYPARRWRPRIGRAAFYRWQKTMDGALVALGFAILFFIGNLTPAWLANAGCGAPPLGNVPVSLSALKSPAPEYRKEIGQGGKWRQWALKKAQKAAERAVNRMTRVSNGDNIAVKVLLTLLLLMGLMVLFSLTLALSCNLSCSGQEALAVLVALLGTVGTIILLIVGLKAIWGGKADKELDSRHKRQVRPPTKQRSD